MFTNKLKNNYTLQDFFEFNPYIDSNPGQGTIEFYFENVTGNIKDNKLINLKIIANWKFPIAFKNRYDITFKMENTDDQKYGLDNEIFDIILYALNFSLSENLKYWEIVPDSIFPTWFEEYFYKGNNEFVISDFEYFVLKNRFTFLDVESEFGFEIQYNEALAKLDKSKNDSEWSILNFELNWMICGIWLIITAIIIIVISRIIIRSIIYPIHDQSECIRNINDSLISYADVITNPETRTQEDMDEAKEVLLHHASQLKAKTNDIMYYGFFEHMKKVPEKRVIINASKKLIKLSNSIQKGNGVINDRIRREIEMLLNFK